MITEQIKETTKKLLNEIIGLFSERKENIIQKSEILESNEEYQKLLLEKKVLNDKIKEKEDELLLQVNQEKERINQNIKIIKKDLSRFLEVKSSIINSLIKFFRVKLEKGIDELDLISTTWLELFEE